MSRGGRARLASLAVLVAIAVGCLAGLSPAKAADDTHFDPVTGYRTSRYRAPTPGEAPAGASRVDAADVVRLVKEERALLVDAMPAEGGGLDLATGDWRITKLHDNIPGSIWLPNVGLGEPGPVVDAFFRGELTRLTGSDLDRAVVIYCQADCWMGWNAVKRAAGYGYRKLYWFADGVDGWREWEGTFAPAVPTPVPREAREAK